MSQTPEQSPSLRHSWSSKERKALVLLRDEYQLAWEILTPVFNCWLDVQQGVRQQVLYSQYLYIVRPATNEKQRTAQVTFSSAHQDLDTLYYELEHTGTKLGIKFHRQYLSHSIVDSETYKDTLKRKRLSGTLHAESEKTTMSAASSSKRQQSTFQVSNVSAHLLTPSPKSSLRTPPETGEFCQILPRNQPSGPSSPTLAVRSVRRNIFTPASSSQSPVPKSQGSSAAKEDLPLLGFRGFSAKSQGLNSGSGFRAGAFVQSARIPTCPSSTNTDFMSEANLHVGWSKGHPSPFISITTSCIRAIMKSRSPKSGRYLAIFDLHKIHDSGSMFEAKSLGLKPTKPNGKPITYHSGGEYLIWVWNPSNRSRSDFKC